MSCCMVKTGTKLLALNWVVIVLPHVCVPVYPAVAGPGPLAGSPVLVISNCWSWGLSSLSTLCPELAVVSICPVCVKSLLKLMTADERLFGQKNANLSHLCGMWAELWWPGAKCEMARMASIIHQPQLSRYQLYPPLLQTSPTKYLEIRNNTNIIRTKLAGSGCKYLLCLNIVPFYIHTKHLKFECIIFWRYTFLLLFFSFCCCVLDDIFLWFRTFCLISIVLQYLTTLPSRHQQ